MSIKDYRKVVIITDATTGDHIDTLKMKNYQIETILNNLKDLLRDDIINRQNGILIKYGIE